MPISSYEYAAGFNNSGSAVNIETLISKPPRANPVPFGTRSVLGLDATRTTDGAEWVFWRWSAMTVADLDTLVTTLWGDWDTENVELTVNTRDRDGTFSYYNVIAHVPREGEEFIRLYGGIRENVTVRLYVVGVAT